MSHDDLVKYGSEKAVKKQDACVKKEKNMLSKMGTSWNSVLMYKRVKKIKVGKKFPTLLVFRKERDDEMNCWIKIQGDKYLKRNTNVGFMLVDQIAKSLNLTFSP